MNERSRILHLKGDLTGGSTTISYNYEKELYPDLLFDWLLANTVSRSEAEKRMEKAILALDGRTFYAPPGKSGLDRFLFFYRFFRSHKYQIVHIDTDNPTRWRMMLIAMLAGVPNRIMHVHSTQSEGPNARNLSKRRLAIHQLLVRCFSTDYFACSQDAGLYMFGERGVRSAAFHIIHNGTETERFCFSAQTREQIRQREGILARTLVVGFVGRLVEVKNLPFLLDVFAQIHARRGDSLLWIVGDGELREKLEADIESRGLNDCVKLWGARDDVNQMMQAMDVLLMPSCFEGFPMVTVEAQTSGLPVFASTGVPQEAALTAQFHLLPLEEGPSFWADAVLKAVIGYSRKDCSDVIREKGYDIHTSAKWMCDFYHTRLNTTGND